MPKASKMPSIPNPNFQLHVGWRTIKTAVTAMLVAVIYCLIDRNPAFACIGVIFGLGYDMEDSIKNGGNRLFGTLIGGLLAIVVFWLYLLFFPQGGHTVFLALLLGVGVVILILLCNYFWPGGVQPGGVVLCIVAAIPLLVAACMDAPDVVCTSFVSLLLILVACGVYMIIRVGMIKGSYDILLQEGDYTISEKKLKKKLDAFSGAYWCIATAIYLGWSFWTMRWDFTWIIWPVAGVLFAAVSGIFRAVMQNEKKKIE